ncbi:MAG: PilZ domain-containing protein [Deltaproteobacteria bacterium]|nr:PilZ domain-containing protein [Deltaproteobacteria bacterium]
MRFRNPLVGMEKGHFILIKLSPNDLMGTFRSESIRESNILISYMDANIIYGFQTEILNVVSNPAKLFFLAYPRNIKEISARNSSRYECVLPATAMLCNELIPMAIIDISEEGCQCVIKKSSLKNNIQNNLVQINKKLCVNINFPGTNNTCAVNGSIRTLSDDIDKIKVGLKLEELSRKVTSELNNFISLVF